jgi:hypothetical protein
MLGYVAHLWMSGAADIIPLGATPNRRGDGWVIRYGEDESQDVSDLNDLLRSLPVDVEWSVPGDQKHSLGNLRECGKFRVTITIKNVPASLKDKISLGFIQPEPRDIAGGVRILGSPDVQTKGDRVTISATAQVGNILALGLQGSSYFRLKVFLTVPDLSPGNSDEVVLKALELQKFNKADPFKSFGVRDTIPGADSKAPFKTCDDKPLKK